MQTHSLFANSAQNPLLQQLLGSSPAADLFDADEANTSGPAAAAGSAQPPPLAPAASSASDLFGSDLLSALTSLQSEATPPSAGAPLTSPAEDPPTGSAVGLLNEINPGIALGTGTAASGTSAATGSAPAAAGAVPAAAPAQGGGDGQTLASQLQTMMMQFAQDAYSSISKLGDPAVQTALASV